MSNYERPEYKAARDFHASGVKNNTYAPGTMSHRLYENEWLACFDQESRDAKQQLEVIYG